MTCLRVFPRRTNGTPDDAGVRVGLPTMFDEADEVRISVAFEWDIPAVEKMELEWRHVAPVTVGGPALGDPGGEFEPGMWLKRGYTITSRGCPNSCWFCRAWKTEGHDMREYPVKDGWILQDNNLLACSEQHIGTVFDMLERQPHRARFTGGIEAARLKEWHVERMANLKPAEVWLAYDDPAGLAPMAVATSMLEEAGLISDGKRVVGVYVLSGYKGDTIQAAEGRCVACAILGARPMAMLYNDGREWPAGERTQWKRWARTWIRPEIVGCKMKEYARR